MYNENGKQSVRILSELIGFDEYDEAVSIIESIDDPNEIIDATSRLNILHRLAQGVVTDAAETPEIEWAKLLKSIGVNFNAIDMNKMTPLHHVSQRTVDPELMSFYLDNSKNINQQDKYGNTPAIYAAKSRCFESLVAMMKRGADFDVVNHDGKNIAHFMNEAGLSALETARLDMSMEEAVKEMEVAVHDDGSRTVTVGDVEINIEPLIKPKPKARRF